MKKNVLVKVGGYFKPQTVDMTSEEIAEFKLQQAEIPEPELTPEERLTIMEDAFAELCEVIFNG